jgi:hypothetical protein
MLKPIHLCLFEKEVIKAKKRGKDIKKLKEVMKLFGNYYNTEALPASQAVVQQF